MDQDSKLKLLSESFMNLAATGDRSTVVIEYVRDVDTLYFMIDGLNKPAVSVRFARDVYLRVSPDESTLLGVQIEHFLSRIVPQSPGSLDLLDQADDPGLSDHEIMELRRKLAQRDPKHAVTSLAGVLEHRYAD